jgi:hypothetical protein
VPYRERNLIARSFSKPKHSRRAGTGCDKRTADFLATTRLASMPPWLRSHASTA